MHVDRSRPRFVDWDRPDIRFGFEAEPGVPNVGAGPPLAPPGDVDAYGPSMEGGCGVEAIGRFNREFRNVPIHWNCRLFAID